MKRTLFALINYILLFIFVAANPAWAASTQLYTQVVVSATQLNVRSAPTTSADKVSTLSKNAIVDAISAQDGWFQVALSPGQYGWVHGDYVYTKDTDPNKKLVTTKYAVVSVSVANMRSNAATDAKVIATLKQGDSAAVIKTEGTWIYVRLADGKLGYIPSNHVKLATMTLSSAGKPTPLGGFKKVADRQDPPSRSDDRDEPPTNTPPTSTPPANSGQTVLTLNGSTSSAGAKIEKIEVTKNDKELTLRIVTDKPISYNDKQEGTEIKVNLFDAQGIDGGYYDLYAGNVEALQVSTEGTTTVLTINAASDSAYTTQRVSGKPEFLVTIPLTKGNNNTGNGNLSGKIIVLDAGHGGLQSGSSDPGAIGPNKVRERDVVLEITKKTKALLEAQGATVLMTREGDETKLSLDGRAKLANDNAADVFVAIHANASTSPTLAGTSTYFYAPATHATLAAQRDTRKKLAQSVQDALVDKLKRRNIGILEANFAVLRATTVPSILVETAFISNPEEEKLLANDAFRQQAAEGIANGLVNYFTR